MLEGERGGSEGDGYTLPALTQPVKAPELSLGSGDELGAASAFVGAKV